jgi:hypothetical protein
MKNNSKHITLILFGIISIIVSACGYLYIHDAVINQAERYSIALKDSETYDENKKNEQNLQKIYKQTVVDRAKLDTYIITEDKVVNFIESLENIGKMTNTKVALSSIDSEEMKDLAKGTSGHIKAKVDIKGSWSNVMTSLSMLENLPFSITLDNSKLSNNNLDKSAPWSLSTGIRVLSIK